MPRATRTRATSALDPPRRHRRVVAVVVAQFALAGLTALVIVGLAVSVASQRIGQREAIVDVRAEALSKAQAVVEPGLSDDLLAVDAEAAEALDVLVRREVLDGTLVRVKIWRRDGTILYADEDRLIGSRYQLGGEELDALDDGRVEAEVSDLSAPENRYERPAGKLLEVYLPLRTPDGTPVLFEAYFRYDAVEESGDRVWRSFAPITLGSLVALQLIQIPLAWSLARRLRSRQQEREQLLSRAIGASEQERRRIAQDLHDGVVQDLAGVSYALAAGARRERPTTDAELTEAADTVRAAVEALRTLLVEIYPPDLAEEGLGPALADLVGRVHAAGLVTEVDTAALAPELPLAVAGLVYRTVQELLRNVVAHAGATTVRLTAGSSGEQVWAEVVDDGRGFEPGAGTATAGHFGLTGLADLASSAGGRLVVSSAPGAGTTARLEVPLS